MLSAGRLAVEVGLWSLVSGPIRIRKLELHDVAVLLEQNDAGEANWTLPRATPPQETADSEGLPVVVEVASLDNLEVLLRLPDRDELRVAVTALELRTDPRGVGTVDASGSAADTPFTIKGTFAPGGGSRARVELDATIADTALRAGADLRPRQVDFTASTADLSRVAALLAVTQELPAAPLELAGTLLLAADHYELRDATAKLLTAESRIAATVPRTSGEPIAIEVSLTAPDVSELRAGLPPLRLASSVKGAISAERIDVDPLTIELGDSDFSGAGSVVLGDVIAIAIKGQSKLIELTPFRTRPAASRRPERGRGQRERLATARRFAAGRSGKRVDVRRGGAAVRETALARRLGRACRRRGQEPRRARAELQARVERRRRNLRRQNQLRRCGRRRCGRPLRLRCRRGYRGGAPSSLRRTACC